MTGSLLFNQGLPSRMLEPIQGEAVTANIAHRHTAIDGESIFAQGPEVAILAGWCVLTFVVALKIFRWE